MTQPQSETKLFAQFKTAAYSDAGVLEIRNVQEAVAHGLQNHLATFQTYEVTSIKLNGTTFTGELENLSGTHHLGVDKLVTAAEIVAEYDAKIAQEEPRSPEAEAELQFLLNPPANRFALRPYASPADQKQAIEAHVTRQMRDVYAQKAADTLYYTANQWGDLNEVNANDRVYNKQGQQIWPKSVAGPVSNARPAAGPRP